MAIDTQQRRRNTCRMAMKFIPIGLVDGAGISTSDRANLNRVYIGYNYNPSLVVGDGGIGFRQGIGVGVDL